MKFNLSSDESPVHVFFTFSLLPLNSFLFVKNNEICQFRLSVSVRGAFSGRRSFLPFSPGSLPTRPTGKHNCFLSQVFSAHAHQRVSPFLDILTCRGVETPRFLSHWPLIYNTRQVNMQDICPAGTCWFFSELFLLNNSC